VLGLALGHNIEKLGFEKCQGDAIGFFKKKGLL